MHSRQRYAYRRGEKTVLFLKKGIKVASVVVLGAVFVFFVKFLFGAFPVKKILVSGNHNLEAGDIRSVITSNSYGRGLLRLSLGDLEAGLQKEAWVKRAVIRKQIPDTLMIRIEESAPKALLIFRGSTFLLDEEGDILEELEEKSTPFLPVIMEVDPKNDRGGVLEALKLIDSLAEMDFLSQKDLIEIMLKPYGLLVHIEGVPVKVGFGRYAEKLGRWKEIETEIKGQDVAIDYVDLRYGNEVIIKPSKRAEKER